MLDAKAVAAEEENLRLQVRTLSDSDRSTFYTQFEQKVKDPDTYAVLNYLFITGLHHFYLNKWLHGAINLVVFFVALTLMFTGNIWFGLCMIAAVTVVELYALFRSQLIIQDYNNRLMRQLLTEVPSSTSQ